MRRARLDRIYRPASPIPRARQAPFGLTRYGFSADSGYRDNELFAGESGKGLELLLCERGSAEFPSPNCLAIDRPLAPNVSFSYRFKRAYLARWREISAGVDKLDREIPQRCEHASRSRRGRLRQIHFQDRHVEGVGDFAVLFVLEQHADKFAIDMHFDGIRLLGPLDDGDGVETEQVAQIFLQAPDFAAGQGRLLMDWAG